MGLEQSGFGTGDGALCMGSVSGDAESYGCKYAAGIVILCTIGYISVTFLDKLENNEVY